MDNATVSVIIPVFNDAEPLRALLNRLVGEPGPLEVIVADGGSSDATAEVLARFPNVRRTVTAPGRGRQMNAGARLSRGGVLLFLHCDTYAPRGTIAQLPALLASSNADFGAFRIRFDPPVWLPQLLAVATRLAHPWCCFGDQGIFVRREFFLAAAGFPEIALLEDVHWLRQAGRRGRMVRSRHTVVSSARRFQRIGVVRQSLRNLSILIRDLLGANPEDLARRYEQGYRPERPLPAGAQVNAPAAAARPLHRA